MKILLVEDTDSHARLARTALELFDSEMHVHHVGDADEALVELGRVPYDIVLLDYYLPSATGLTILRTIRDQGLDVPVIIITSQGQVRVAVECLKSGANDYISKDEGYVDLLPQTVQSVYRQWQAEKENRELHVQVLRKKEELEASNRKLIEYELKTIESQKMSAIMTLVRGICHEINNPLTGILGYSQLLQETFTEEGADDLREIEACAQRCREIIAKLAKFCRHEKIHTTQVDVNEILEDSLAFVEYYANRHQAMVVRQLQADIPRITGNAQDLRQAFLAVVMNGIQAMKHGGILTVKSVVRDGSIMVVIADTGEGIPQENLDQIFTPFFTTREVGLGSGMGLALAYGVMGNHRGEIRVESTVGEGSSFSLVFPLDGGGPNGSPSRGVRP